MMNRDWDSSLMMLCLQKTGQQGEASWKSVSSVVSSCFFSEEQWESVFGGFVSLKAVLQYSTTVLCYWIVQYLDQLTIYFHISLLKYVLTETQWMSTLIYPNQKKKEHEKREGHLVERIPLPRNVWSSETYWAQFFSWNIKLDIDVSSISMMKYHFKN